jgi:8-oxo-dGTP diphosphatase
LFFEIPLIIITFKIMPLLPAAIAIILSADKTAVLLVKREDVPVWVLPGGGTESGEMTEESLIREVREETGYLVQIQRKCAEYYPVNRLTALTSVFVCNILSGQVQLSEETSAIAFHPLNKLPRSLFPPHAHWLREAMSHQTVVKRGLTEVSYLALCKYFVCHPWWVIRYIWTRLSWNRRL